jgi:putative ABC transport system permease protein
VTRVTYGVNGKFIDVNGAPVQAALVLAGKGPLVFSLIDGRYPSRDGELALGTQTLAAAKAQVGSRVPVAVIGPSGKSRTSEFTVTGTIAFPPSLSAGGLGDGAIVPLHAAAASICPAGPASEQCIRLLIHRIESTQYSDWGMGIATAPTAAGRATAARLERRFSQDLSVQSVPTNLVNFGEAVNFPALLGVTLALFGAATLAHLLFVTVSRRRREIALLKVLGFVRRQVGTAVCSQATTVAVIGIVVGVPTGIAVGHVIWLAFASNLGAVPLAVVPVGLVAAIVAGVVVVCNVLAFVPAALAARLRPAEALREA